MSLPQEARKLIETIRHKGVVSVTRNALEVISTQLYDKSTRFLLELLQNADDNAYNCLTPTLNFTYKLGSLRVDCNEVGFRAQNVEAICSIGVSTKAGLDHSTRYIGEKGIGFKSVFKVADAVWITSREYTFKFDRRAELGMIAPVERRIGLGKEDSCVD